MKKTSCQTLSKGLAISSAAARVAPNLLKALIILPGTTARRFAVDREDLKPYQTKDHISRSNQEAYYLQVFQRRYTNQRKWTNRTVDFSHTTLPTFLNTRTRDETFQQSGKHDSFRHILNNSANMNESSSSHFFRTTTEIQSGPDPFDKARLVMTFLTNLGVTQDFMHF